MVFSVEVPGRSDCGNVDSNIHQSRFRCGGYLDGMNDERHPKGLLHVNLLV